MCWPLGYQGYASRYHSKQEHHHSAPACILAIGKLWKTSGNGKEKPFHPASDNKEHLAEQIYHSACSAPIFFPMGTRTLEKSPKRVVAAEIKAAA